MFGAILGDIVGSPYEFDQGTKTKRFPLFSETSEFTDDTVMTIAVCDAFMSAFGKSDEEIKTALVESMKRWGRAYPHAGYGSRFAGWLQLENSQPYHSFGNGSAMRVSSTAWLYHTMEEVRHAARLSAVVTHNHPEGIKGAEATASAIFLGRTGHSKEEIRQYMQEEFQYDLSRTCDEIRPAYRHVESCMETAPQAITAFLESGDYEETIRTAISLGGDTDTLAAIAGSIAEGYFGVPGVLKRECYRRIPPDMQEVLQRFEETMMLRFTFV